MDELLIDLLRTDGSIMVNKRLARAIGLPAAAVYAELLSKYKYYQTKGLLTADGYFYCTVEDLETSTNLGEKSQATAIQKLVNMDLISKSVRGIPAKRFFRPGSAKTLLDLLQSQ
jgi:3,4-dihydroxy-2-butanone 4-phosphate synthase